MLGYCLSAVLATVAEKAQRMAPYALFVTAADDGVTAVPVFAYIGTAPVFDDGGCTDIVSATANL